MDQPVTFDRKKQNKIGSMMAHAFHPSTQEAEAEGSLWVQDQSGLQSEFQNSQEYAEKPCLVKPNQTNQPNK